MAATQKPSLIKPPGSKVPSTTISSQKVKEMPPTKIPLLPNTSPKFGSIERPSSQPARIPSSPKLNSSKPTTPKILSKSSPKLPKYPISKNDTTSSVKKPSSVESTPATKSPSSSSPSMSHVKSASSASLSSAKCSPSNKSSSISVKLASSAKNNPSSSNVPFSTPTSTPRPASHPLPRTINALLPNEILLLVFRHLRHPFLLTTASTVCLRWQAVANEPGLWKSLFESRFQIKDATSADWKSNFIKKTVSESLAKFTGKLKRAPVSNTAESIKLLRLTFRVHINENEIRILARDVSCFQFATSIKCNSIPHTLLKEVKKVEISVESVLLNGGKLRRIASMLIKKENLVELDLPEKAAISLYETKLDGFHLLIGVFPGDKELGFVHITCSHLNLLHSVLPSSALVSKPLPINHKAVFDDLDRDYGLRRYSASISLRSSGKVKWSSYFTNVDYDSLEAKKYVKFVVLDGTHSPHMAHSFEGSLALPWKTDTFSNTAPNLGIVDWLLQDDTGATMWLESGAIQLVPAGTNKSTLLTPMSTIYDLPEGEIFEFQFENPAKGRIEMRVVYSESEKRTTLWEFIFVLHTSFLNSWFATTY